MSSLKIELTSNLNRKGFDEAKKASEDLSRQVYQQSVRQGQLFRSDRYQAQAQLNLFRQGSDVFTSSMLGASPLTVAIQQGPQLLDILASGALSAGKFATMLGGVGIAVAGIGGAISSFKQMKEAIDDAKESQERLNKSLDKMPKSVETLGIAPGQEKNALKFYKDQIEMLRKELAGELPGQTVQRLSDDSGGNFNSYEIYTTAEREKQIYALIAKFEETITKINTDLVRTGAERQFGETISKSGMSEYRNAQIRNIVESTPTSDITKWQQSLVDANKEIQDIAKSPKTKGMAERMNNLVDWVNTVTQILKGLDEKAKAADARAIEEEPRRPGDAPSEEKMAKISSAMTDARTRIGGMANAPILSAYQTQIQLLRQIATNTSMRIPPASPATAMPVGGN